MTMNLDIERFTCPSHLVGSYLKLLDKRKAGGGPVGSSGQMSFLGKDYSSTKNNQLEGKVRGVESWRPLLLG